MPVASTGELSAVTTGKKKKWGLSSVFGGGAKSSSTSLAPVAEVYTAPGSSSLKRTQSGNDPSSRGITMSHAEPPNLDPKQAKKEAERAKREAERVKREAAALVQKERARAVLQKRQEVLQAAPRSQIEYSSDFNAGRDVVAGSAKVSAGPSSNTIHGQHAGSSTYDLASTSARAAAQSAASVLSNPESQRSHHSIHSHQSKSHPVLPSAGRPAYELGGRHKARRRDEDDDHSMSSFDHNSLRSRSVLTIGTIDSE
jgi:meiosis induction protein kinase IME2/SME1